jgi:hypothetical protein
MLLPQFGVKKMFNYNSTQVGVPYVRVSEFNVAYDLHFVATLTAKQDEAVKLADGTIRVIGELPTISFTVDMKTDGAITYPCVDPITGTALGFNASNNQLMLFVLAAIRSQQLAQNV